MKRFFALPTVALLVLSASCARVPATQNKGTNKVLVITLTTRGPLDVNRQPQGNYYYVVVNRTDDQFEAGPAPVIQPPWGNGFAAPSRPNSQGFVGFVRYSREEGLGGLGVYSCQVGGELVNPTLGTFTPLGPPDRVTLPQAGGSTLSFQLDLGRLPNADKRFLQINLIATDILPSGVNNVAKRWDALGDGSNGTDTGTVGGLTNYVVLDTRQNQIITNAQQVSGGVQEIPNDVRDRQGPLVDDDSLDIVDWTIQLRDP